MIVYRIDRKRRARHTLSGIGAELYGGRWNYPGLRAVYCAGSRALAMLEMLVHIDFRNQLPEDRILVSIDIPSSVHIETWPAKQLDKGWDEYVYSEHSQKVFGHFVAKNQSAVLTVPSAIVPEEPNYIINPLHRDFAKIQVMRWRPLNLDPRLI